MAVAKELLNFCPKNSQAEGQATELPKKLISLCCSLPDTYRVHMLNDVGMLLGYLSSFGMMVVAAFQTNKVTVPHLIGAGMAFVIGFLYCWVQTYLTYVNLSFRWSQILDVLGISGYLILHAFYIGTIIKSTIAA